MKTTNELKTSLKDVIEFIESIETGHLSNNIGRSNMTIESFALRYYKTGQFFYSIKQDKDITALATYHKVKIKTERMIAIDSGHERIENIIKVTIL